MDTYKLKNLLFILIGMIYLNIYFRFLPNNPISDNWTLMYYLLLNFVWIDFMRVSSNKIMKEAKEEMKQNSKTGI